MLRPFSNTYSTCLALFYCLIQLCRCLDLDLTIELGPGKRECFHQFVKEGDQNFEVEYQVISGGDLDIDFQVFYPSGEMLINDARRTDAVHKLACFGFIFDHVYLQSLVIEGGELDVNMEVRAPSGDVLITDIRSMDGAHKISPKETGDYMICLDNSFSQFSKKTVFFEISTDEPETTPDYHKDLETDNLVDIKLEDFRSALNKIDDNLKKSTEVQNMLRIYEARDRSIAESNFDRVNFWSGVNLFVMMSVALVQVFMIRSLFEDKSAAGRFLKART